MINLGRTFHGKEIPRFSEDELNRVVQQHWNDAISPNLSFADLYRHKRQVAFTPMQELVLSKWYLDRSIVIGDAAHKVWNAINIQRSRALF
jgi:2-polyprenyl-6-methoxyphenol hydroxylase-like FAD-dependent oxidoreductase